ncbi:MAG TPA: GNAT family N-acetyltransferase [Ktedonobacteraceae bacterium]|nr:GNAT family N-acetyltransferase [Ktedonobacteraceae bacterium]
MAEEWKRAEYLISTDKNKLDLSVVHDFLTTSYWAAGIPMEIVKKSVEHSLNFGVYYERQQVGFARVITDYATFAYIGDVFILEEFRGRGLSKWLLEVIANHPELQGLRRWLLLTRDAHGLYEKTGFVRPKTLERYMERHFPDVYKPR